MRGKKDWARSQRRACRFMFGGIKGDFRTEDGSGRHRTVKNESRDWKGCSQLSTIFLKHNGIKGGRSGRTRKKRTNRHTRGKITRFLGLGSPIRSI